MSKRRGGQEKRGIRRGLRGVPEGSGAWLALGHGGRAGIGKV